MKNNEKYEEILSFQKAVAEGSYDKAEEILLNAKHVSSERIASWHWQIKAKKKHVNISELFEVIVSRDFSLDLLYIYFEKCLEDRDIINFDRMYSIYSITKCDRDSPIYFYVIGNFLHGKISEDDAKLIARILYTNNDLEFTRYLD